MISTDKLERVGDEGSVFAIVFHGHWSEIVRVGDPADIDHVKHFADEGPSGAELYVSAQRGFSYRVLPRDVQTVSCSE